MVCIFQSDICKYQTMHLYELHSPRIQSHRRSGMQTGKKTEPSVLLKQLNGVIQQRCAARLAVSGNNNLRFRVICL